MKSTIFILADNQDISNAGIRYLLKEIGCNGKHREARNKNELIQSLSKIKEATVVLDYTNMDFNNIDELLIVSSRFRKAKWILFSDELSLPFLKRIYLEKTFSLLLKNSTADEIKEAFLSSHRNERYICQRLMQFISLSKEQKESKDSEIMMLTHTEQEILKSIALGRSVKEIAEERFSSVHTIMTHKKNIFRKLEVNNIHEATKYALRSGLIDTMEYYI
ncbi:MAG: response regulator transcription factor [Dysgonamonadaceae bacterium]|nr:response regulator transcription factor [Dysgonamonadaceae bacterium]